MSLKVTRVGSNAMDVISSCWSPKEQFDINQVSL
jgi:hypothetical protein